MQSLALTDTCGYATEADDFGITLAPQTRGRWLVHLRHKDGYSPPWPRWQDSLEDAKRKALICVEDAAEFLAELEAEHVQHPHQRLIIIASVHKAHDGT